MTNRKKVAVIGAGISGMASIKHLKEEGLEPVCFEKSDKCGGTWCYRQETEYAQASIMPTTVINHCKELGALSDFPPSKEFNNFMKHSEVYQYFFDYIQHFNCEQHIRFEMEVIRVEKSKDYIDSGRWNVSVKNRNTGEVITETYDGVIVATGHINMPAMTSFRGQEKFKGKILHTHSLKEVEEFTGQNVVIVGMGCSALDAAVEISRVAKQVYISTRSGAYVIARMGPNGYPIDYVLFRRYLITLWELFSWKLATWYAETFYAKKFLDDSFYYVKPKYQLLAKDPIINDLIASKFLSGSVIQKTSINYFTEKGIVFDGEESITDVDSVIMATGYTFGFPFLEDGVLQNDNGVIKLYKCMYPIHLPHSTLAFIGIFDSFGAGFPLLELQARWAALLLAGCGKLPSKDTMMRDVMERHTYNKKRYIANAKQSIKVDYVQFMDEIAKELDVKPNLIKYIFTDFPLFLKLFFGPCLPYQYRLEGHGKWEGARNAIMTSKERVEWPLCKRKQPNNGKHGIIQYLIDYVIQLLQFFFTLPCY